MNSATPDKGLRETSPGTRKPGGSYHMVIVAIAGLVLLVTGIVGFGIYRMSNEGDGLREIARHDLPMKSILSRITEHHLGRAIALERSLRYGEEMQSDPGKRGQFDAAAARFEEYAKYVGEEFHRAGTMVADFESNAATERDREELVFVREALIELDAAHAAYEIEARKVMAALREDDIARALATAGALRAEGGGLDQGLAKLSNQLDGFTRVSARTAAEHERSSVIGMVMLVAIAGIVALAIGALWVSRARGRRFEEIFGP